MGILGKRTATFPTAKKHLIHRCFFVLSAKYRCRTRPGPPHSERRFCAVQAFCRRQNLGAGRIHCARAFESPQDPIKITTPDGVVIFMEAPPGIEPGMKVLQTSALPLGYGAKL